MPLSPSSSERSPLQIQASPTNDAAINTRRGARDAVSTLQVITARRTAVNTESASVKATQRPTLAFSTMTAPQNRDYM